MNNSDYRDQNILRLAAAAIEVVFRLELNPGL